MFTFKLEEEVGQGQDAAADHGHCAHEARVNEDEVTLQGLWGQRAGAWSPWARSEERAGSKGARGALEAMVPRQAAA